MITRVWHGTTKTEDANDYKAFLIETRIKEYRATTGNLGAQLWQRTDGSITHIWAISWWKDYASIQQFAGEEYEKAKYFDEDKKYLLQMEPEVLHYETFDFR